MCRPSPHPPPSGVPGGGVSGSRRPRARSCTPRGLEVAVVHAMRPRAGRRSRSVLAHASAGVNHRGAEDRPRRSPLRPGGGASRPGSEQGVYSRSVHPNVSLSAASAQPCLWPRHGLVPTFTTGIPSRALRPTRVSDGAPLLEGDVPPCSERSASPLPPPKSSPGIPVGQEGATRSPSAREPCTTVPAPHSRGRDAGQLLVLTQRPVVPGDHLASRGRLARGPGSPVPRVWNRRLQGQCPLIARGLHKTGRLRRASRVPRFGGAPQRGTVSTRE